MGITVAKPATIKNQAQATPLSSPLLSVSPQTNTAAATPSSGTARKPAARGNGAFGAIVKDLTASRDHEGQGHTAATRDASAITSASSTDHSASAPPGTVPAPTSQQAATPATSPAHDADDEQPGRAADDARKVRQQAQNTLAWPAVALMQMAAPMQVAPPPEQQPKEKAGSSDAGDGTSDTAPAGTSSSASLTGTASWADIAAATAALLVSQSSPAVQGSQSKASTNSGAEITGTDFSQVPAPPAAAPAAAVTTGLASSAALPQFRTASASSGPVTSSTVNAGPAGDIAGAGTDARALTTGLASSAALPQFQAASASPGPMISSKVSAGPAVGIAGTGTDALTLATDLASSAALPQLQAASASAGPMVSSGSAAGPMTLPVQVVAGQSSASTTSGADGVQFIAAAAGTDARPSATALASSTAHSGSSVSSAVGTVPSGGAAASVPATGPVAAQMPQDVAGVIPQQDQATTVSSVAMAASSQNDRLTPFPASADHAASSGYSVAPPPTGGMETVAATDFQNGMAGNSDASDGEPEGNGQKAEAEAPNTLGLSIGVSQPGSFSVAHEAKAADAHPDHAEAQRNGDVDTEGQIISSPSLSRPSAGPTSVSMTVLTADSTPVHIRLEGTDGVTTGVVLHSADEVTARHLANNRHELVAALDATGMETHNLKIDVVNAGDSGGNINDQGAGGQAAYDGSSSGGAPGNGAGQNGRQSPGSGAWSAGGVFAGQAGNDTNGGDGARGLVRAYGGPGINITA
ncbi:hypothetical protein JUN65_06275 [Gluconacetobacter azotocaptans]|uniref:hypothetical protein n=1 Tax=Gluconacetobacter azotocaptans TaxID=142834 RepID=UPI0019591797|nr:hypothetical protein [Gluconacetobacter azotocaptans]MBM9401188.1 hypothetical protein [Gluconacetobacter azotocaptans]